MMKVVILGNGNVGHQLYELFSGSQYVEIVQWYGRSFSKSDLNATSVSLTNSLDDIVTADVCFLAVSDNAIPEVSKQLPPYAFTVHTAGSVSLMALKNEGEKGVFYPLQSFSKGNDINFKNVPICVEADSKKKENQLKALAENFTEQVYVFNSDQRLQLHLAAVLVNNFANYLFIQAEQICKENDIPFSILHPLIEQTIAKIKSDSPSVVQTGPARRNDTRTLSKHIEIIQNQTLKDVYLQLTKAIQDYYER